MKKGITFADRCDNDNCLKETDYRYVELTTKASSAVGSATDFKSVCQEFEPPLAHHVSENQTVCQKD